MPNETVDVLVAGGGLGGVAAALAAAQSGCDFAPDEHFSPEDQADFDAAVGQTLNWPSQAITRAEAAALIAQQLNLVPS